LRAITASLAAVCKKQTAAEIELIAADRERFYFSTVEDQYRNVAA